MKLQRVQQRLRQRYVDGIPTKVAVLEEQVRLLGEAGSAESESSIRRMAHQLSGSAASFGFPDLGVIAKEVEHAPLDVLSVRAGDLIAALRTIHREEEPASPKRILVIDDDPSICELIEATLTAPEFRVTRAATEAEATQLLKSATWDLVFLDLLLPDRDGRLLLADMRTATETEETPVIVLSGSSAPTVRNECVAYGIDGFIDKPFDPSVLGPLAHATVDRRQTINRESSFDELTQLYNRWGFRYAFAKTASLCRRYSRPCTLAILDIDHFKAFNDEFGHEAGDRVLSAMAQSMRTTLRESDILGRWGGEEFVVGMPETNISGAEQALAKFAADLKGAVCEKPVTFSAGLVEIDKDESLDLALLRADERLYAAKKLGRDRILSSLPENMQEVKPGLLIVEDDCDVALALMSDLGDHYQVRHAKSSEAALEILRKERYSAILLDNDLPGLSGLELTAILRERTDFYHGPIFFLTTTDCEEVIEQAFAAGASDYVTKPYRRRELLARLARTLAGVGR